MQDDFLWVEKYRPRKIEDCVLPEHIKKTFQQIVESGEMHNMLLCGTAGLGKTTVAKSLCNELDLDFITINASEDGNIDTLRGRIKQFASTVSFQGGYKVVILDEADYLNAQSTQPALRGFIEEFANNCRFIMTCNFKNRIIEPLHSRCAVIEFNIAKKDTPSLCGKFMKRLKVILDGETVKYDDKVLAEVIMKFAPDWRRVINECQRYGASGSIDTGMLSWLNTSEIAPLISSLKDKDFRKMRQWVADNMSSDPSFIYRKVYDDLNDSVVAKSIPEIILILAEYQYKNAFVADHELNTVACMIEIMASAEFK
tara:strand:+ start:993 stop:1931 length:939 start_codon:yes stop_codon:yes gene_type:complete